MSTPINKLRALAASNVVIGDFLRDVALIEDARAITSAGDWLEGRLADLGPAAHSEQGAWSSVDIMDAAIALAHYDDDVTEYRDTVTTVATSIDSLDFGSVAFWAQVISCAWIADVVAELDRIDTAPEFLKLNGSKLGAAHQAGAFHCTCDDSVAIPPVAETVAAEPAEALRSPQQAAAESIYAAATNLTQQMRDYRRAEAGDFPDELEALEACSERLRSVFKIEETKR